MMDAIWPRSYPDVVKAANDHWIARHYIEASLEYVNAARVAPRENDETLMLEFAWEAEERAAGRISELESEAQS